MNKLLIKENKITGIRSPILSHHWVILSPVARIKIKLGPLLWHSDKNNILIIILNLNSRTARGFIHHIVTLEDLLYFHFKQNSIVVFTSIISFYTFEV